MRNSIIILMLLLASISHTQEKLGFKEVDSISYSLYMNKEFKELQKIGKSAIRSGVDCYHLRMRMGISYYENKNYERALPHFLEAYAMNPRDTTLQTYYYYSLIFTLRQEDAVDLLENVDEEITSKLLYNPKKDIVDFATSISNISITGGGMISNNIASNEDNDFVENGLFAENTLQGNTYLSNMYLENRITQRLNFCNAFTYYNIQSLGIAQSNISPTEKRSYTNNNYQYNFSVNYTSKKSWKASAYFGYYKENTSYLAITSTSMGQPQQPPQSQLLVYNDNLQSYNSFTGGASIYKRVHNFNFGINTSIGNLAKVNQFQLGGEVIYYPFGNTSFYSKSGYTLLNNNNENQHILLQYFGGNILPKLAYTVGGMYGDLLNFTQYGGIYAYNSTEPILFTGEIKLSYQLTDKLSINPNYAIQQRESSFERFNTINSGTETIFNNYLTHKITCTFEWKF